MRTLWHSGTIFRKMPGRCWRISQEALVKKLHLYLLTLFYQKPYDGKQDFYSQFEQRLQEAKQQIGIAG